MADAVLLDPTTYRPHDLHTGERIWPETNCYVDLWIELLHALDFEPRAALGFTVEMDFEGDQFTFFKFPPEDLQALFGLSVRELAVYESVEQHAATQLLCGRPVLAEVDSFYLPDTAGTAYRREHVKTTVAIINLDRDACRLGYLHNSGYHELEGEDFDGVFRRMPLLRDNPDILFPYVEFVKRDGSALTGPALVAGAVELLRAHLRRRPATNPLSKFRRDFPGHVQMLMERPMTYFHLYTFNVLRQLGANFELLGDHCAWLQAGGETGLDEVATAARELASVAKALQFQLARAVNRKKSADHSPTLDAMERAHDTALGALVARYG
ncbi:MAG: DUF1839 family protein [Gemmatimonadetes bacterium]|nr:DUF1839 family protein [Gemmatimonadota bacterium]